MIACALLKLVMRCGQHNNHYRKPTLTHDSVNCSRGQSAARACTYKCERNPTWKASAKAKKVRMQSPTDGVVVPVAMPPLHGCGRVDTDRRGHGHGRNRAHGERPDD